ncbi:hypothetical protein [Variovorax sp. CY25R-8]|uniref:hypothetical protein n=1 Tax=Variovorax sp. CY25R-8 TaxID=2855501 RepID=UPI0021BB907A|nr:hypothetical protein [Variovorax sp. CY25R-8]MCT8176135.1 hypothetical protein [Variovorax sp. CY25R-8]
MRSVPEFARGLLARHGAVGLLQAWRMLLAAVAVAAFAASVDAGSDEAPAATCTTGDCVRAAACEHPSR